MLKKFRTDIPILDTVAPLRYNAYFAIAFSVFAGIIVIGLLNYWFIIPIGIFSIFIIRVAKRGFSAYFLSYRLN